MELEWLASAAERPIHPPFVGLERQLVDEIATPAADRVDVLVVNQHDRQPANWACCSEGPGECDIYHVMNLALQRGKRGGSACDVRRQAERSFHG